MEIRLAKEKDIPNILKLLVQVNKVHADLRPDLFRYTTKYSDKELLDIISDEGKKVFVCVDENDEVIGHGFCEIQDYNDVDLFANFKSIYIDDICVDGNHRRLHVGQKIFDAIKAYARENGFHSLTLNVWEGNNSARNFYESQGMTIQKTTLETILD